MASPNGCCPELPPYPPWRGAAAAHGHPAPPAAPAPAQGLPLPGRLPLAWPPLAAAAGPARHAAARGPHPAPPAHPPGAPAARDWRPAAQHETATGGREWQAAFMCRAGNLSADQEGARNCGAAEGAAQRSEQHTSRRAVWAQSSAPPPLPPAGAAEARLPTCWSIDAAPRLVEGPPAAEGFRRPNACSLSLRRSASPPLPGGIWAAPRAQSSAQARHSLRQLLAAAAPAPKLTAQTAQQALQIAQQSDG